MSAKSRFSLPWSLLHPASGVVDLKAIDELHRDYIKTKKRYATRILFFESSHPPAWLCAKGGWQSEECVEHYLFFVQTVCSIFGKDADSISLMDMPNRYAFSSVFLSGSPDGKVDYKSAVQIMRNMFFACDAALAQIRKSDSNVPSGLALDMRSFVPARTETFLDADRSFVAQLYYQQIWIDMIAQNKVLPPIGRGESLHPHDFLILHYSLIQEIRASARALNRFFLKPKASSSSGGSFIAESALLLGGDLFKIIEKSTPLPLYICLLKQSDESSNRKETWELLKKSALLSCKVATEEGHSLSFLEEPSELNFSLSKKSAVQTRVEKSSTKKSIKKSSGKKSAKKPTESLS